MINSWTSNYAQSQYSVFVDPEWKFQMEYFKSKLDRTSIEHRRPTINVRSRLPLTNCVTEESISQSAHTESFWAKMRNTHTCFPILPSLYHVATADGHPYVDQVSPPTPDYWPFMTESTCPLPPSESSTSCVVLKTGPRHSAENTKCPCDNVKAL